MLSKIALQRLHEHFASEPATMLLHKKARDPLQRKPQGPVPRSATVDLVFRTCLTERGSAFADRGAWAGFLANGSLRGGVNALRLLRPTPTLQESRHAGQPPLQEGARSTGRGLRVGVVDSFGWGFCWASDRP